MVFNTTLNNICHFEVQTCW